MSHAKRRMVVALGLIAMAAVAVPVTRGQVKKGKTRPALTKHIMGGIVAANCGALNAGLKTTPADEKAWAELAKNAALINEASYILMEDGRCPDGTWKNAAEKTLREGSAAVLAKVEAKDHEGAKAAVAAMMGACKACHTAHKK